MTQNPPSGSSDAAASAPLNSALPPKVPDADRLLERVSDGYVVLDREYRFIYANPAAERDMRKSLDEIRGRIHWDVFPASYGITAGQCYRAAAETKVPQHFREHYHYEGLDLHMEMSAYPTDEGGVAVFWRDITQQVRAEEALRSSEARLRAVIEALPVGVFVADMDGHVPIINRRGAELFDGAPAANEIQEYGQYRAYWTETGERLQGEDWALARALLRGERCDGERIEIERYDGGRRSALNHAAPIHDHTGRQIGAVSATVDVTAQVEAEAAREAELRASEARARAAFRDAPVPMWLFDVETLRFLDVNAAAVLNYGYSQEEFAEMTLRDIRPPDQQAHLTASLSATSHGEVAFATGLHRTKEGRLLEVEITTRTTTFEGRPARIALAMDVTERRRAEEALRASEERYALAARATSNAIWDWELATGRLTWSEGLTTIFGVDRAGIPEHVDWWMDAIHPDDRARVRAGIHAVADTVGGGTEWKDTYRFRRADGAWADVLDRAHVARDAEGRAVRMIGAMEDVTAQRQLEARLRQAQKMEAVGQLAGGVAHDFNNLLTVIGGNLEFLRADLRQVLTPGHQSHADLGEIAQATDRARGLVRQLLTFSRRQPVRPQRVRLGPLVEGAERLLQRVIGEEIILEVTVADGEWHVDADPGQMEQVLMNLAVNARDAMLTPLHGHDGRGGVLSLEVDTCTLSPTDVLQWDGIAPGRWVRLRVRDTGHGMDTVTQAHAFEPFFTTKEVGAGTGLGLATVFGIVRQAGGAIRVESALGGGATFTLLFPALPSSHETATPAMAQVAVHPHATVLLVEDETALRATARRMLERQGYSVLEARHGGDALLVWREHHAQIDIVVTDLRMPELGGRELVSLLRAERATLPVVLLSGYADPKSLAQMPAHTQFVPKPFTSDLLLGAVARLLVSGTAE